MLYLHKSKRISHFVSLTYSFLQVRQKPDHDLVMIRHAQSQFNKACEDYRKLHKIPYVWKQLCNHEGFDQKVLFNESFMDCKLTEYGKAQCKKTGQFIKNTKIDLILVSPQLRALQTCSYIFTFFRNPIIVEPLLVGPLRSCCDINKPTSLKRKLFPTFDFSRTEQFPQLWYLQYLPQNQVEICKRRFQDLNLTTFQQQSRELVQLLKEGKIYEEALTYRKRIQKVKNKLVQYKKKYSRIAIISHYYTIQYLSAKQFMKCGTPIFSIDVKNSKPYFCSFKDILSIQQQN